MLHHSWLRLTFIALFSAVVAWTASRLMTPSSPTSINTNQDTTPIGDAAPLYIDQPSRTEQRDATPLSNSEINLTPPTIAGVSETLKELVTAERWNKELAATLRESLLTLPQSDLAEVTRWARQLDRQAPAAYLLLNETLTAWMKAYPDTALTGFLDASGQDDEWLDFGLPIIIHKVAKSDPEKAWRELNAGRYLTDRKELEQTLLSSWARNDPSAVADAISKEITSRNLPANGQAAAIVAGGLWDKNPEQTIQWIQSLPPEAPAAGQALSAVMDRWLSKSPQDAIQWLADTPASPMRDAGVVALVGNLQASDPELAVRWATELQPGPQRTNHLLQSLQSLNSLDPSRTAIILQDRSLLTEEEAKSLTMAFSPAQESRSESPRPGQ